MGSLDEALRLYSYAFVMLLLLGANALSQAHSADVTTEMTRADIQRGSAGFSL